MCDGTTSVPHLSHTYLHTYICISYTSYCYIFRFRAAPAAERSERVAIRVYCCRDSLFFFSSPENAYPRYSKVLLAMATERMAVFQNGHR